MLQFSPIFMTPGYTKHHKNQMIQFSLIFMTPGNTKLHYNQMLLFSLIFMTPGNTKLHYNKMLQFSLIFNPGYMKHHKNQMLQFSLIFMTPGTRNFTKIKCFYFLWFSWPRVHKTSQKSNASIFSNCHDPGYTKHHKNQILQFSPIFQAWALESNQFPLLLLLAFLSSTRFAATCAFVGYRATKIGLWEIQISPGYLFLERKPPHLGVFYTVKWERPQGKEGFSLGISNLGWFGFLKAQFWWHGILQRHRLPGSGLNSKGEEEKKLELVKF